MTAILAPWKADVTLYQLRPTPNITVVVPVIERPESLKEIYLEYAAELIRANRAHTFLFILHTKYAHLERQLTELIAEGKPIEVMHAGRAENETSMLRLAISRINTDIVVTLPAYKQIEPAALPDLICRLEQGADVVVANRWPRNGAVINRIQSWGLNAAIGSLALGFEAPEASGHLGNVRRGHDVACGVRAIRRSVLDDIPLYGDFARFLPLVALHRGYKVAEVPCKQHVNDMPTRIYSPKVYMLRAIDILGLFFLLRFTEKPLRFFGAPGGLLAVSGVLILAIVSMEKLQGVAIADRPVFLLGVLLVSLGTQAIALGLIGEMIVHFTATRRRTYRIANEEP